jgi:hypothetical protein
LWFADSSTDSNKTGDFRKYLSRLLTEIARLSEQDLPPNDYYREVSLRLLQALAAPACAVWAMTRPGTLQLQFQVNLKQVGIDQDHAARQTHDDLLRHAIVTAQPLLMTPHSGVDASPTAPHAGNPTAYLLLLAPVLIDGTVAGLLEVFQDARRPPAAYRGFLRYLALVAELAARYVRKGKV